MSRSIDSQAFRPSFASSPPSRLARSETNKLLKDSVALPYLAEFPLLLVALLLMMKSRFSPSFPLVFLFSLLFLLPAASPCAPLKLSGVNILDEQGKRWIARGSAYEYSVDNANAQNWRPALDLLFSTVPGLNLLRLYEVDPLLDYQIFLNYTCSRGIYLLVPVSPSKGSCVINRDGLPPLTAQPASCYPSCLLSFGQQIVNIFSQANNVLAFVVANEVLNSEARWAAAPCLKGYVSDLKAFQSSCPGLRAVPLAYTAADNPIRGFKAEENNRLKLDYLTCGDPTTAIDLFGINTFRWCEENCTAATCGLQTFHDALEGATVPIILTEIGCSEFHRGGRPHRQRTWREVSVYLNSSMTDIFSGVVAFSYGIRSGAEFSFFSGGYTDADRSPGFTKTCAMEEPLEGRTATAAMFEQQEEGEETLELRTIRAAGNQKSTGNTRVCNVDEYAYQLSLLPSTPPPVVPGLREDFPECPEILNFDMTATTSRQGADGYDLVECQAETLDGGREDGEDDSLEPLTERSPIRVKRRNGHFDVKMKNSQGKNETFEEKKEENKRKKNIEETEKPAETGKTRRRRRSEESAAVSRGVMGILPFLSFLVGVSVVLF